jgi:uncharacterized damage-inducible protein DinB
MRNYFAVFAFSILSMSSIYSQSYEYLKQYVRYNSWANEQLQVWMRNADETVARKEVESSFSSLYQTSVHLWNAEFGWLTLLRGEKWESPGKDFKGDFSTMCSQWLSASKAFQEYVEQMEDADFSVSYPRSDSKRMSAIEIIMHVCNHSTYHRGQLITIGRQLGLPKPPRTDFIYFISLE